MGHLFILVVFLINGMPFALGNQLRKNMVITKTMEEFNKSTKGKSVTHTVMMPKELTAENGAKCVFIGEFHSEVRDDCLECEGLGHDDTEEMEECEECEGSGSHIRKIPIEWTMIKEIYAMAVKHLAE